MHTYVWLGVNRRCLHLPKISKKKENDMISQIWNSLYVNGHKKLDSEYKDSKKFTSYM